MCLLTFLPPGERPDLDALRNGAATNDDGHGFAIVARDQLIVRRSLHADALIEAFDQLRAHHLAGPALFHSRFGTHGNVSLDNCHPFPVAGDPRTVIAHNGILPTNVQPAKGDPRCDTRIAAEDYLPTLGSLRARRTRLRIQRWMSTHNKIVILTVDRRFRQPAYLLNEAAGIWHHGIWYSNHGFRHRPARRVPTALGWPEPDPEYDWPIRCHGCRTIIDPADPDCACCGACLDCGEPAEDCQCYPPAYLDPRMGRRRVAEPS